MMKMLITAAAAGVIAALRAPVAQATTNAEAEYLRDLQTAGITGVAAALVADGHTMCNAIAAGTEPADLAATYYKNADGLTRAQANAAVSLAIQDLCPGG